MKSQAQMSNAKFEIGILPARHMPIFVDASTSEPRTAHRRWYVPVDRRWQAGILFEL